MAWPGNEYVLGTNAAREGLVAHLPEGTWSVTRLDAVKKRAKTMARQAEGRFTFDALASRAVLFHFQRNTEQ